MATAALDIEGGDIQALNAATLPDGQSTSEMITQLIATVGENMMVRRAAHFVVPEGAVAAYIHNATAPDLGRIGVLVALKSDGPHDRVQDIGRKVAMHIAATQPLALKTEEVDPAAVERERAIFADRPPPRQAACGGREDDRGPHPQVLRGSRAPEAVLRHGAGPDSGGLCGQGRQWTWAMRWRSPASCAWRWAKAWRRARRPTSLPRSLR